MAFKMKGSPMKRNFNVGGSSPMAMKTVSPLNQLEIDKFKEGRIPSVGGVYTGNIEGETIPQDVKLRADEIEKEMEANRTNANTLQAKIEEYVKLNTSVEGENLKWNSKEALNIYLEQYKIYEGLTAIDVDLVNKLNQARLIDYPATVSDSTGQAGQIFFDD